MHHRELTPGCLGRKRLLQALNATFHACNAMFVLSAGAGVQWFDQVSAACSLRQKWTARQMASTLSKSRSARLGKRPVEDDRLGAHDPASK